MFLERVFMKVREYNFFLESALMKAKEYKLFKVDTFGLHTYKKTA